MIQFEHVSKVFGKNQILKDVNFTIDQGNFVTIIGASGCGRNLKQNPKGGSPHDLW